jgi:predicted transcriptional regulator
MTTQDVLDYFQTQVAIAKALGITQSAVSQWDDRPPMLRQYQIQVLTQGGLRADV